MAYPTCPGCLVPQQVGDDAISFGCFYCYQEIRFHTCPRCMLAQSVVASWAAFTCSNCGGKVDLPRSVPFQEATKASRVDAVGNPWPPL